MTSPSRFAGVRVAPLAVLLVGVAVLLAVRVRDRPIHRARGGAAPVTSSPHLQPADAGTVLTGLGAPPPQAPGRVADDAGRMLHDDPRRTHRAHGHVSGAPVRLWTYATAGPVEAQITAAPDEQTLYVASLDGTVTALSRGGGKKWAIAMGDRVYSAPFVADDGNVYVGSDAKKFVSFSPEGRVRWSLETEGDADTGAAPTRDGNLVFAAGSDVIEVRPSGSVVWRFHAKRKVFTSPAVADDGTIVFGSQDHRAYALSPRGAEVWSLDLGADVDGGPTIDDAGDVYFGTDGGEVVKIHPDGTVAWRSGLGGYVRGPLSIARNGDALAGVYGPTPREVRLAPDGTVRGSMGITGTGALEFGVHGGALEDDAGSLVFGAQDDVLYVTDGAGALRWSYTTGGDVDAPATLLSDGTLVVGSDDGKVYAFGP